jgi:hypothetical protein
MSGLGSSSLRRDNKSRYGPGSSILEPTAPRPRFTLTKLQQIAHVTNSHRKVTPSKRSRGYAQIHNMPHNRIRAPMHRIMCYYDKDRLHDFHKRSQVFSLKNRSYMSGCQVFIYKKQTFSHRKEYTEYSY